MNNSTAEDPSETGKCWFSRSSSAKSSYGPALPDVCADEPVYGRVADKAYCVLHLPGDDKYIDFQRALDRKLQNKNFNFTGVWFPGRQSFHRFTLTAPADFSLATFSGDVSFSNVKFGRVDFKKTLFRGRADFGWEMNFVAADFFDAVFEGEADFSYAVFKEAYFHETSFLKRVRFFSATFKEVAAFSAAFNGAADFRLATFGSTTSFNESSFNDQVRFTGNTERRTFPIESSVRFESATFAKPELASFHTVELRPGWFINVDARKFDFTSVDWIGTCGEELQILNRRLGGASNRLLEKTCNQLAVNAEENQRYEESSRFRYMAMEARRLGRARGLAWWRLDWWYWAASGYGERAGRGLVVLAIIWLLFAGLYTQVGFARWKPELKTESDLAAAVPDRAGAPLPLSSAFIYSLGVMSLQRPEPSPATPMCYTLIAIETILGPVEAALVALAIRRKFMR